FHTSATSKLYTLSLHDALPISFAEVARVGRRAGQPDQCGRCDDDRCQLDEGVNRSMHLVKTPTTKQRSMHSACHGASAAKARKFANSGDDSRTRGSNLLHSRLGVSICQPRVTPSRKHT